MNEKIGVYVCSCGTNISEIIAVDKVAAQAGKMPGVAVSKTFGLLCSEDGKAFLENEIRENGLDRLVVAACSPRDHEPTFRKVCAKSGLKRVAIIHCVGRSEAGISYCSAVCCLLGCGNGPSLRPSNAGEGRNIRNRNKRAELIFKCMLAVVRRPHTGNSKANI